MVRVHGIKVILSAHQREGLPPDNKQQGPPLNSMKSPGSDESPEPKEDQEAAAAAEWLLCGNCIAASSVEEQQHEEEKDEAPPPQQQPKRRDRTWGFWSLVHEPLPHEPKANWLFVKAVEQTHFISLSGLGATRSDRTPDPEADEGAARLWTAKLLRGVAGILLEKSLGRGGNQMVTWPEGCAMQQMPKERNCNGSTGGGKDGRATTA
ncbi:hypothetical protein UY3_05207 [Chelonia mydas]|uniref:Uncharacterized protein n=1 Tax=Chelonia mydas TaxID=8469 RepID=M7CAA9_CHEMY|nr:hypothetical protein UY3_05207 [Chelonia mydas]